MITAASIVASMGMPSALPGQTGTAISAHDSIPSFDELAREVLVVRLQAEAMRGSVAAALRGQRDGDAAPVGTPAWRDSVRAAQSNIAGVEAGVRRLGAAFRASHHRRGMSLIADFAAPLAKARRALEELSRADDARVARIAIAHLVAGLEALLQTIDEGKRCCQTSGEDL